MNNLICPNSLLYLHAFTVYSISVKTDLNDLTQIFCELMLFKKSLDTTFCALSSRNRLSGLARR